MALAAFGGFGGLPGIGLPPGLADRPAEIQYSFQNTQNDYVTIFLPDGTEETVHHGLHGGDLQLRRPAPGNDEHLLRARPGTDTHGYSAADRPDNNVIVSPAQVGPVTFIDQSTGQIYNPTSWKYTDAGRQCVHHQRNNGLESVTDTNGNTLTYSADGVRIVRMAPGT